MAIQSLKDFVQSLPRPVRFWSLSVLLAFGYIFYRLWALGGKEHFLLVDRILAVYAVLGLIIFMAFFLTKDPD